MGANLLSGLACGPLEREELLLHRRNLGSIHKLVAHRSEVARILLEKGRCVVVAFLEILAVEEKERIAVLILLEVVGIVDLFA